MQPWTEFEEAVRPHLKQVRAYCSYLTSSKWEAEDLMQEALLRAFKQYRDTGRLRHPRSLLYKIARNVQIDAHRKHRGVAVPIEEAQLPPYHDPDYASVRGMVEWLTELLSERETEMLLLAEVFDYTYQDIADRLQCTVPAVKMVLHRSKKALRKRGRPDIADYARSKPARRSCKPLPYKIERWTLAVMAGEI
ncbi:RNA polymerase sigma factor [Paenibacillus sp. GCM10023250]|uniref:RNA polymerase sigma factor n=1 Tax=Paenibacillus sp. GCM10023250 TaxID=3252648 RepID=UPI003610FD4D